ncbi:MAG: rod shape-determining protein MreC [Lachnospiraceae bacterium]|nr:rod shape-determining protein MreC [Lachnospiraceae bacterium]
MKKFSLKDRHILLALIVMCLGFIIISMSVQKASLTLRSGASRVMVPLQNGINIIGSKCTKIMDGFRSAEKLAEENRELKAEIEELKLDMARFEQQSEELARLETLLSLGEEYPDYEKVAAVVIAKDPGNWYSRFIINKGSADGIKVDMNVLANGALFGIVTETGKNWAAVRSIIDDESNISAMLESNAATCTVTGSLLDMNNGTISFYGLRDTENAAHAGDRIVTSNISEKYLPGLLVGTIDTVTQDANNLTRSGKIVPAANFEKLREVLVILELKQTKEEEE